MRYLLIATIILSGLGFTVIKGGTFKGGEFTKESQDIPANAITYTDGTPWRAIDGTYIIEAD